MVEEKMLKDLTSNESLFNEISKFAPKNSQSNNIINKCINNTETEIPSLPINDLSMPIEPDNNISCDSLIIQINDKPKCLTFESESSISMGEENIVSEKKFLLESHSNSKETECVLDESTRKESDLVSELHYVDNEESVIVSNSELKQPNELTKSTRAQRARRKMMSSNIENAEDINVKKGKKGKGGRKAKHPKIKTLTIGQKMEIIKMIDQKISPKLIKAIYEVKCSTFYDIKKNAEKIREYANQNQCMRDKRWERKSMKRMGFPEIEKSVYDWFLEQKAAGVTVRGVDIQETAQRLAKHYNQEHFKASAGWLFQFRKRHALITRTNKSSKRTAALKKAAEEAAAKAASEAAEKNSPKLKSCKKDSSTKNSQFPRSKARTIGQKLKVVEMIEKKVSTKVIMNMFKLKRSTFYDIRRDADKIREFAKNNEAAGTGEGSDRRSMKKMGYPEIDKSVYTWYQQQKSAGASVRGVDIQHAAERFAKQLDNNTFKASSGWLFRFRKRHCLAKLSVVRAKGTVKKVKKKNISDSPSCSANKKSDNNSVPPNSHPLVSSVTNLSEQQQSQSLPLHPQQHLPLSHQHQMVAGLSSQQTHQSPHSIMVTTQHQHYHINNNHQHHPSHTLALNHQHQPLSLTSHSLQALPLTTQQPLTLSSHQPLSLSSQQTLHLTQQPPLALTTHHHPSLAAQHPLQLSSHHHHPHHHHQSLQIASHQQIPLTSHQPLTLTPHQPLSLTSQQPFNLNTLNNHYQINALNNHYHISKGT